jgi:hypothetical protein
MNSEGNSRSMLKYFPAFRQERQRKEGKPGLIKYHVSQRRIEMDVSCIELYNTSKHWTTCLVEVLRIVRSASIIEV